MPASAGAAPVPVSAHYATLPTRLVLTWNKSINAGSVAASTFKTKQLITVFHNTTYTHAGGAVMTIPLISGGTTGLAASRCEYLVPPGVLASAGNLPPLSFTNFPTT